MSSPTLQAATQPADQVLDNWLQASFAEDHPARKAWDQVRAACTPFPGVHSVWTRCGGPALDLPVLRWGIPFARITAMQTPGEPVRWALAADQSNTMIEPMLLNEQRSRQLERTAEELLADPATPNWVVRALRSALDRDPVKAAGEAEVMARVLARRADQVLETDLASIGRSHAAAT
jgi:hypothetical protein